MKILKISKIAMSLVMAISLFLPFFSAQAAPAEGYSLKGWDKEQQKWSPGNLSGYQELDWVPFSLEVKNYQGNAVILCIQHDYEKLGVFGYSEVSDFYIGNAAGEKLYVPQDGVFSVSGPEYIEGNGGVLLMEFCFDVVNPQALIELGNEFFFYWETRLAGPGQASTWSGSSLHTTTSVTGAQTVPINIQKIASVGTAKLELKKTASATFVNPGDSITYSFEVTNSGDYSLSNVIVRDPIFGETWSYPLGTLAAQESKNFDVNYTIPINSAAGILTNTATAAGTYSGGTVSETDDETVYVQTVTALKPAINIHKNVNVSTAGPGDSVTYSIHVTNTGNVNLENVTVTDPMFGESWSYSIGTLHSGEIARFEVPYTIPSDAVSGLLVNTAEVTGTHSGGQVNSSADTSLTVDAGNTGDNVAGVELVKGVDTETANPGDTLTYFFIVRNTGTYALTDIVVSDPMFGASWSYSADSLEPGSFVRFELEYSIPGDAEPGVIENTAMVSAAYPEGILYDTATETVSVLGVPPTGQPSLTVDKNANISTVIPGNTVSYSIHVNNNGIVDLENVFVTDHLMGDGWSFGFGTLHVGETKEYAYSYTVPLGSFAGNLTNTVTATGYYNGEPTTAADSVTVIIDAPAPMVSDLVLNPSCTEDPDQTRGWRISNTNHVDVSFSWELLETGENGTGVVSADSDFDLETHAFPGYNTLKIIYLGNREEQRMNTGLKCQSEMELITLHSMCVGSPDSNLVEWQFSNPNEYPVTATWETENQTGIFTIMPGVSSLQTVKIPNNPNTISLYINNELYAVESRACFQDIILAGDCSPTPQENLDWTLTNNNYFTVNVDWVLLGSNPVQEGTVSVPAYSTVSFSTVTIPGSNTVTIFVDDVLQRNGTVMNTKLSCAEVAVNGGGIGDESGVLSDISKFVEPSLPGGTVLKDDVIEQVSNQLPATGGSQMLFIYLAGIFLMLAGFALLIKPKKR